MRHTMEIVILGIAALGACAGNESMQTEAQPIAEAARYPAAQVTGPLHSSIVPRAVDGSMMTVVAVLGGPSVADLQEAAARKLTRAEKVAVKVQRLAEQAAPRAQVEAAGGKVIGSFQSALNGLKVRIPRGKLDVLRSVPGVVDVKRVVRYTRDSLAAAQRIAVPFARVGATGVHGEGIKIAIIDGGIDYTHADFGGPGTPAAFAAAAATSTLPADPALFGPGAAKVKGGIDLVGDAYDSDGSGDAATPVPDPNPLDCNGHGSHVAGIAAGFGVLADGATYRGPYDPSALASQDFAIGPGVAPLAELYAVRVFGCSGATEVLVEALEWAIDNDMDVANMSLGGALGTADSADEVAADNAVKAGVVVVASAGNDGDVRYILSSPASSTRSIAVAAAAPGTGTASFSSSGPRAGDSALKPDIAAPGEGIASALIGSGAGSIALSGTGMAAAQVAGTAALAIQSHPRWTPAAIKAALLNTGNSDDLADYATRRVGTGTVDPAAAVTTTTYAFADRNATTLNFGLVELSGDFTALREIHLRNDAATAATFRVGAIRAQGSPHQLALSAPQITVPARSEQTIVITLTVPAATAGNSDDFRDVAGLIAFTPVGPAHNRGVALHLPYYLVPRVSTSVGTQLVRISDPSLFGLARITNLAASITGTADLFTWGLQSPNDRHGRVDLRAAGAQAFDVSRGRIVIFAINTYRGWSTPETQVFHVLVDSNGDGTADFDVFSADFGLLTTGFHDGLIVAAISDLHTGTLTSDFVARAPTDAATILLPVLASSIGVTPTNPRFSYTASSFDRLGPDRDAFDGWAGFNAFTSAVTNALFATVPPDGLFFLPISVDRAELARTPARGLMLVTQDNPNGPAEAQLIKLELP